MASLLNFDVYPFAMAAGCRSDEIAQGGDCLAVFSDQPSGDGWFASDTQTATSGSHHLPFELERVWVAR
jgi:hypothetical protein